MAYQVQTFVGGGRTFVATKHIPTKLHTQVIINNSILDVSEYQIMNNSLILNEETEYDVILKISDDPNEFENIFVGGIIDNLTSNSSTDALSARQGKELKTQIDDKADLVNGILPFEQLPNILTYENADTLAKKTEDRNGFNTYDSHTVVEMSFDDGTRTLNITRQTGVDSYEIYCDNELYTIDADLTFTIDNTEGIFYVYFEEGVLTHTHTFSLDLLLKHSLVAIGYWSVALQKGRVNFEGHSAWYPSWLHVLMHKRDGATYQNGISISATVDGDGSSDDHIRFSSTSGYTQDEDLLNPVELKAITTDVAIYYKTNTEDWLWTEDPDCVVLDTGVPVYNEWTGTAWTTTQMTDGYYGVATIATHPSVNGDSYVVFMGENEYANIADASEAVRQRPNTDGLPAPEYRFIEARVFKYDSNYTNAKKCAWVSLDDGSEYVDWRYINGLGSAGGGLGAISSSDVTDEITYPNITKTENTQKGVNDGIAEALTPATQAQVDAGLISNRFVAPDTLKTRLSRYMILEDQKPYNQAGGNSVVGLNNRALNTVVYNNITGASLDALTGIFTLPAGIYLIRASAPAARVDAHQLLLSDLTNSIIYTGTEEATTTVVSTTSFLEKPITLTAPAQFRLISDCRVAQTVYGLGGYSTTTANTNPNVYSKVTIQKIG